MTNVPIENIKAGMVLARPVFNFHNILLLKEQTEITAKSIQMLKSWGISSIWVVSQDREEGRRDSSQDEALLASLNKQLDDRFAGMTDDPVMLEIRRIAGQIQEKRVLN